jgi:GNAT superfamily N-acetyltransferase
VSPTDLTKRCVEVLQGYFELGNTSSPIPLATLVRNPQIPRVHDANCVTRVRAGTPEQVDALLEAVEHQMADASQRTFKLDPLTPSAFEARLLLDDHDIDTEVQMLLDGDLRARQPKVEIRPVVDERDWASLARLFRMDHEEEAERAGRQPFPIEVTEQIVTQKRLKAPAIRFFLAVADASDVAFFSSWPGRGGIGKVEDLFTRPDHRGRGFATALIAHCVADARARGAGRVLIGAEADDTPRHLYADLGFTPVLVLRSYTRSAG